MKVVFSSVLAPTIKRYLDIKQALGRRYDSERQILFSLDQFLYQAGRDQDLSCDIFFQWCEAMEGITSGSRRKRMHIVRNLCLYRSRREPECYVPDPSLFPHAHQPVRPYIFSESEIRRLLDQTSRLKRAGYSPLRPELFRLIVILLFTTGLRRGELLRLNIGDYDPCEATLLIRASKYHKSRLLPLPDDVRGEIDAYLEARRRRRLIVTLDTPLVWNSYQGGRAYSEPALHWNLERLLKSAKIQTFDGRTPRIHDFRHSFAVNAMLRWYRDGVDVQTKLPFLSAYMGHVSIVSTYYYLQFIEPLATLASARFARAYGILVSSASVRKEDADEI